MRLPEDVESPPARPQIALISCVVAITVGLFVEMPRASAGEGFGSRAVTTESAPASHEAMRVLRGGGNAMDAAVTAALVSGVASPSSSGLGGGGFALVYTARTRTVTALDFREVAPRAVDASGLDHRPLPDTLRGKLVGVPGQIAGLYELHRRFGKKPWESLVTPAAKVALDGTPVSAHTAEAIAGKTARITLDDVLGALFVPGGHARLEGAVVKLLGLSQTLTRIGAEGPRAFYEGPVAAELVARVAAAGGSLSADDLTRYKPVERPPLVLRWEGHDIYTFGPPSAGSLLMAEALGAFTRSELRALGESSPEYQHLLAEILRGAMADRMRFLGDPDFEHVDYFSLLAPYRMSIRRKAALPDKTRPAPSIAQEEHGTHHLVTADADGNIVSLTITLNSAFGSQLMGPTSGVVLNDELDDFTTSESARAYGVATSPNRARPYARPVSSMTPTIVFKDGEAELALGGSGGMAIGPNVTEVLLSSLAFDDPPRKAVSRPRFGVPLKDATIAVEAKTSAAFRKDLEGRGEVVITEKTKSHAVQLIAFEHGRKTPAADPRKGGSALVE